jgi:putative redox protein
MEVFVEHVGGVRFKIDARNHTIESDQPVENGGSNAGMTPPEFLLAALGSCAGYYAAQYLKKRKLPQEGTRVRVTAEKAKNPARLDNFRIEVQIPAELTEEQREEVEEAVEHCLIHNTLLNPARICLDVESLATVTA